MPCLSGKFNPAIGILINIGVLPANTATPTITQFHMFPALLDTGASITCISLSVVQALNLVPIGMRPMVSATHAVPVNQYLVDLIFPFGSVIYIMSAMQVMEFVATNTTPFQILLGRDIICKGILTMSFDGHFTFSL
uniref:Peptidase A2 domain-containing protein n=1 Tax=Desulfobacca acetoxidans TaxID=60893 RepID=A0A7V4G6J4_9BACT